MCIPGPSVPQGPTQAEREAIEAEKRKQKQLLEEERRNAAALKAEQLEITQATIKGQRNRRSLLAGKRKGGSGFDVAENLKSKQTLGA